MLLNTPIKTGKSDVISGAPDDWELDSIRERMLSGESVGAERDLKRLLTHHPLSHEAFALLGEVYETTNRFGYSVVAYERSLQLKELNAGRERSEGASRLADLEAVALKEMQALQVDGQVFPRVRVLRSGEGISVVGRSLDGEGFIKVEISPHPLKARNLEEESGIVRYLSDQGCLTSPRHLGGGVLCGEMLEETLGEDEWKALGGSSGRAYPYYIQQYLPADNGYNFADIALAMIEQKAFGVYHGDIRPDNIRFDAARGICCLVDYDQAELLDEEVRQLSNTEYFNWCIGRAKEKYKRWNHTHFLAYFPGVHLERDFWPLFRGSALNLANTNVFRKQITTADKGGIYHSMDTRDFFIKGERNLDSRSGMLDGIKFERGETVLDIGCSSGILSVYLAQRGCRVTGVEIDTKLINGSQILANIMRLPIRYMGLDLDNAPVPGDFDTICMFSVIHHTRYLRENGRKVANACGRRILIECRLKEEGLKWMGNRFERSSAWDYPDLESLYRGMEELFPGFRFYCNHGQGDRHRYILELHKSPKVSHES